MDEEAEDRFTELARTRLADTLSEAARLLSGPSEAAPARRTERLGIDEVLLGLSRHPTLGLVPDPSSAQEPGNSPESPGAKTSRPSLAGNHGRSPAPPVSPGEQAQPGSSDAAEPRAIGVPGRPPGLRNEVDQLRADVETARRRVEAAEVRAEEHEAALDDLRCALDRLRRAGLATPPYERPSFASVVIGETTEAAPSAPVPVVALALGTMPGPPAVLHAAKLGEAIPAPTRTPRAELAEANRPGSGLPAATASSGRSPAAPDGDAASDPAQPARATQAEAAPTGTAGTSPVGTGGTTPGSVDPIAAGAEPDGVTPEEPAVPGSSAPGPDRPAGGYSWPFAPPTGRAGRRRFWNRW